jgi:hypothetical protein
VLLVLLSLGAGCAQSTMVRMPVTLAARVPVRVFPVIWVAAGAHDPDQELADVLAAHLAEADESEIRRVELSELEPARVAGKIPPSTVVVLVEVELRDGLHTYWDTAPTQTCGFYTCTTQYESYVATANEVSGRLTLTVYEGPTARVLQTENVVRTLVGDDPRSVRGAMLDWLADDVQRLVDSADVTERVHLYRVSLPEVKAALARIENGDWEEGRALLEQAKERLSGMKKREQAKVFYNLGMARRFAPGPQGLDAEAYAAAKRAFEWAVKLDPSPQHQRALTKLERQYVGLIDLEAQRRARAHNFTLPKHAADAAHAAPADTEEPTPSEALPSEPLPSDKQDTSGGEAPVSPAPAP